MPEGELTEFLGREKSAPRSVGDFKLTYLNLFDNMQIILADYFGRPGCSIIVVLEFHSCGSLACRTQEWPRDARSYPTAAAGDIGFENTFHNSVETNSKATFR